MKDPSRTKQEQLDENILLAQAVQKLEQLEAKHNLAEVDLREMLAETLHFYNTDITERKRAEEKIKHQQYLLEKGQDIGRMGSWDHDLKRNILRWTDEICRIFGVPPGSVVSHKIFYEKIHPDDREFVNRKWKAAVAGKPYDIEYRLFIDGVITWVREKADLEFDEEGVAISAIGFTQDITEQKQVEKFLRESEERFKTLSNLTFEGILIHDNGVVIDSNDALVKMLGYTREELIGENIIQLCVSPEYHAKVRENLTKNITGPHEVIAKRKNGTLFPIEVEAKTILIRNEKLRVAAIRDITKRKKIEGEVVRFKTISENANHGNAIADLDGNITYINKYFAEIHGYTSSELIGKNLSTFHSEKQLEDIIEINESLMQSGSYSSEEVWHTHKNGAEFPMLMNGIMLNDINGIPQYLAASAIDISKVKNAEREIRRREHQLAESQAVTKIGSWDLNLTTRKSSWSAETYRLFDKKPEEFSPSFDEFTRFIHPDDLTKFQTSFSNALKGEDYTHHENIRIINDSGREWILEVIGKVRCDINGKAVEMMGTAQDITESKRIEEKVIFLSYISRQVVSAMITTNTNFEINWTNAAFEKLYGYTQEEVIGETPDFFNAEPLAEEIQNNIYQTVSSGKIWRGEALNKRKDDSVFPCEMEISSLVDETGKIFSYCGQLKDITERKQAEDALKKIHDELEIRVEERTQELKKIHEQLLHSEKLAAIGGLSASIAHEFNNPLYGVMSVIEGVKRRTSLDEEDAMLIDMAITECHRMKDLIKSLQEFNRPSSDKIIPFDIHATIDSLLLLSKKEYYNKGITVATNYAEDMVLINGVADQIKQVILNVLNNGVYACEGGGTITINTGVVGKKNITIKIQDTGKGIESENMGKIYDPFFTTKPTIKGVGLGLSVSHGIIKKHGGRIDIESELGRGTAFTITLPIEGVRNA